MLMSLMLFLCALMTAMELRSGDRSSLAIHGRWACVRWQYTLPLPHFTPFMCFNLVLQTLPLVVGKERKASWTHQLLTSLLRMPASWGEGWPSQLSEVKNLPSPSMLGGMTQRNKIRLNIEKNILTQSQIGLCNNLPLPRGSTHRDVVPV